MSLSGTAVDGYLKVVKLPLESALGLLGENAPAAKISLDRADATVRSLAALVLNDDVLQEDANRRRLAADERERALKLRAEAQNRSEAADEKLAEREAQAERQRQEAARRAESQREQAEKERQAKAKRASDAERKRKAATEKAARLEQDAIDDRAKRARLEQLDEKSEALDKKEDALTASDEAKRLREAASATKAARKAKAKS